MPRIRGREFQEEVSLPEATAYQRSQQRRGSSRPLMGTAWIRCPKCGCDWPVEDIDVHRQVCQEPGA